MPESVVAVSRVYAWSVLTSDGVPLSQPTCSDGRAAPIGFMPVFANKADASTWESHSALLLTMEMAKPEALIKPDDPPRS